MKLIFAEDDAQIAQAVVRALERDGFKSEWVSRGDQADQALRHGGFDLAILDVGLPGVDGIQVLRHLRDRGDEMPVLLLTARDDVQDRVAGLDAGADDYLVKPFAMTELLARLRALMRRGRTAPKRVQGLSVGRLSQRQDEDSIRLDGELIDLSPREAGVLSVLLRRSGRVASKSVILQELANVDDSALDLNDSAVEVIVHRLRRKLTASGVEIHTVRGFGYFLKATQ
jgi:two-component system OmpR family response regulator